MKGFSTISLIVALGAAVFLGVAVFLVTKGTHYSPLPRSLNARHQPTPSADLTSGEVTTSLPDVIRQGQDLECDFKLPVSTAENPFNTGKLWTTGGKGRSTISTSVSGVSMEANALYQNNTAYAWVTVGGQKSGLKFSPETLNDADHSMTMQERQQAEQFRSSMLFHCVPWTPDETTFILPSDVEFEKR